MFTDIPAGWARATAPPRSVGSAVGAGTARGIGRAGLYLAALAALALLIGPGRAYADPPHGGPHFSGHFDGGRAPGGHFAGPRGPGPGERFAGPRGPGPGERFGGPRGGTYWASRGDRADRGGWAGGWHDPGWRGPHDYRGWDGGWRYPHWRGGMWLGGNWGGYYWPPVDYGWSYPWFLATIPFGAMTLTFGGVPYYYVNQVYYVWDPADSGYVVTDPPPVAQGGGAASAAPPPPAGASGGNGVLAMQVTPLKGQDRQQTANDRYACNTWAVAQSGFDPLNSQQDAQATGQMRGNYRQAFAACLQARGYSVQ